MKLDRNSLKIAKIPSEWMFASAFEAGGKEGIETERNASTHPVDNIPAATIQYYFNTSKIQLKIETTVQPKIGETNRKKMNQMKTEAERIQTWEPNQSRSNNRSVKFGAALQVTLTFSIQQPFLTKDWLLKSAVLMYGRIAVISICN